MSRPTTTALWNHMEGEHGLTLTDSELNEIVELAKPLNREAIIREFVSAVERRAESKMLLTGKLEGAHFCAMKEILKEMEGEE